MKIKNLSDLGNLIADSTLEKVIDLANRELYEEAIPRLDKLRLSSDQKRRHAKTFAYLYYRSALLHQHDGLPLKAIKALEKSRSFPGLENAFKSLVQDRLTMLQKEMNSREVAKFDDAVFRYFERPLNEIDLRQEFLGRYGLNQPQRPVYIDGINEISAVGVYRWKGDSNRSEQWSKLIRQFKWGEEAIIAFFGRVLEEHVRSNPQCREWLKEIDYIVPVPSDARRSAYRGTKIVTEMAYQLSQRLELPHHPDILKRGGDGNRSRHTSRRGLEQQYSPVPETKTWHVRDRIVLLLDDVMNRGYTTSVCAQRLREAGCRKVYLLVLAQAESSLESSLHFGETASHEVERLAPWLCLADAEGLGPVRLKALLNAFPTPRRILDAKKSDLRTVPDIGPKVAKTIRKQSVALPDYAKRASNLVNSAATIGARVLTLADSEYPTNLRDSGVAPAIVYVLGAATDVLQESNTVAIVGTRQPAIESGDIARSIATALADEGWIIVSGMAEGVDSLAHAACLEAGQPTVAFLGNGVDVTYPPSAKDLRLDISRRGALVSEYPFGMRTNENRLRRRNTLTVGHSRAVIVIQSTTDGGTMIAVRAAERLGKPVFCVEPLPESGSGFGGNTELLQSGRAQPIAPHNAVSKILSAVN